MTYDIMHLTASTVRSVIVAPPGKKLVVSDLSNIEGRGLAWLAGEEWKLQAFRDFDTVQDVHGSWWSGDRYYAECLARTPPELARDAKGEPIRLGPDLYKLAYANSFRIHHTDVNKFGRSVGKVMELGLGYAGGINAFVTFALVYGIDLEEMANTAWDTLPDDIRAEAEDFVQWLAGKGSKWPMSDRAAIVCESFKRMWRAAHPMTVQLWAEMEDGFRAATLHPGTTFRYRSFAFRREGAWLRIKLPSGACLCYPNPQVADDGKTLSFMGTNQFTRKWERIKTYGGRVTENATQSIARDFMWSAMPGIEAAGYEIIMRVHDEVPCEAPDLPEYNAEHLSSLLATAEDWGAGMPLAAAGFESYRYKKE